MFARRTSLTVVILAVFLVNLCAAIAQEEPERNAPGNPLAAFSRIVGGEWELEGQIQVYEWGLDGRTIHGRGYRFEDGRKQLVSDGMLFLDPEAGIVRGMFAAEGMGVDLFEYDVLGFEGDRMTAQLRTSGPMSGTFEEIWEFTDENRYEWTLYQITPEGRSMLMSGVAVRDAPSDGASLDW
jgi:hypothetical protein